LKRYRKDLQELATGSQPGAAKDLLNSLVSPNNNQKVLMSLGEGGSNLDTSAAAIGGARRMKRSVRYILCVTLVKNRTVEPQASPEL
jgi:hypothetical protein